MAQTIPDIARYCSNCGVSLAAQFPPSPRSAGRIVYANRFPRQLVEIFERHGFIWGGAWYHYDTMHFEFRPEIIAYSKNLS